MVVTALRRPYGNTFSNFTLIIYVFVLARFCAAAKSESGKCHQPSADGLCGSSVVFEGVTFVVKLFEVLNLLISTPVFDIF